MSRKIVRRRLKGQSMALIGLVLGMGVLIGLVAIAVDGGSALLQRRNMQNAADAGTLAGVQLMSQRVAISGGNPGYPTYALTDTLLLSTVADLLARNRGGSIGATEEDYSFSVYYHYISGSPTFSGTFGTTPVTPTGAFVPAYVDGLRVKSNIHNPTVFAKAIPGPWQDIDISATSAAAIFPTCRTAPPTGGEGPTLPFTRYRYTFEQELPTKANDLCNPFIFWDSNGDVGGPGNSNFKNKLSFNTRSFYQDANPQGTSPDTEQQLLSGFDHRNGTPPILPQPPSNPFDMRGSAQASGNSLQSDVAQWIRYGWVGAIMTNTNRLGDPNVLGDWGEVISADQGQNVQTPLLDLIQSAPDRGQTPISAPWPVGLGWGTAITRTVYLWGEGALPSDTSAQISDVTLTCNVNPNCNCNQNPDECTRTVNWDYLDIRRQNNQIRASDMIERVRFTDAVQIVFYENVNGGGGDARCPDGSSVPNANSSSEARGVLPSAVVPGPPGGGGNENCQTGWVPGASVYYRQIGP